MRNQLLSILMLCTIGMCMTLSYTACKSAHKTEVSSEIITAGDSLSVVPGVPAEEPNTKADVAALLTAAFGVYEIIARLIKTKANISIIDWVWAIISLVLPNKNKAGDVHIKF